MTHARRYEEGQRWEFRSDVPEFEKTCVIARVIEARPEWGQNETEYEVYVRYSQAGLDALPPGADGKVLSVKMEGLDRSLTHLVESGVQLRPGWHHASRMSCEQICHPLPMLFSGDKQQAEYRRKRAEEIQRHREKYKNQVASKPSSRSVAESWQGIVAWMTEHGQIFRLHAGASDEAIVRFEETIAARLPVDFRESLRLHDGGSCWIPEHYGEFLKLAQIEEQWTMYKSWQQNGEYANDTADWEVRDSHGPIKPIFWSVKRIPITDNSGDHLMLDLDPPKGGTYGQILDHSHEVGPERVLAPSWAEFLRTLVDDLETGKYICFEDGSLERLKENE